MFEIDRWRKWKPEKFEEVPEHAPTKPTKPASVGFDGTVSGNTQKIQAVPDPDEFDPLNDLWQPFNDWFKAEIWLDVDWIARCRPGPRCCAGLKALHFAFCDWARGRNLVPPTPEEFRHLLAGLGCDIRDLGGEHLVLGISLKEDVQAQRSFDT